MVAAGVVLVALWIESAGELRAQPSGDDGSAPSGDDGSAPSGDDGSAPSGDDGSAPTSPDLPDVPDVPGLDQLPGYADAQKLLRTYRQLDSLMGAIPALLDLPYTLSAEFERLRNDPIVGPVLESLIAMYKDRLWTFSAHAAVTGETTPLAGVSAGAEVTWDSGLCRLLIAGANAQLASDDGDGLAALSATIGGCLPLPGNTLEVSYTLERDVRPALGTRALIQRGRYDADTFAAAVRFWRFRFARDQIDIMRLSFVIDILRQDDAAGTELDSGQVDLGIVITQWDRKGKGFLGKDQRWGFVPLRIRSRADAAPADDLFFDDNTITLSPLRLEGLRLGSRNLAFNAEVGSVRGAITDRSGGPNLFNVHHPFVDVSVDAGVPRLNGRLGYRHDLEPALADSFLVEDRGTASAQWFVASSLIGIDGFVARSRLVAELGNSPADVNAGGGLRFGHAVGRYAQAVARAELVDLPFEDEVETRLSVSLVGVLETTSR